MKTAKNNIAKQKEEADQLWTALDDLEQYTRKNSLEIHGIPQAAHTDTETTVIKVAEALNITLESEDSEISHMLRRNKAIIVKISSHKMKFKLYKERYKLKHVRISDLFPDLTLPLDNNGEFLLTRTLQPSGEAWLVKPRNEGRRELFSVWT